MASNNNQNGWFSSLGIGFSGGGSSANAPPDKISQVPSGSQPEISHFEQLDASSAASNTLKRNTKIEFTRSDLLQLLSYYEGEFQARDIVIAALKSEKMKEVVTLGRYRPVVLNDPYTALLRDMFADGPTAKPPYSDKDIAMLADQQLEALENLVVQQRRAQLHMANILREAELKHKKVIQELEEEKYKHEHDTAQGDDITYGLEMERTRLKQELDLERQARKKLEKELKRQLEVADEEKARQKQIVLLLLAERKKIIVKYIEERKRSEDLAQILSEEKTRIDTMAEGLEEESKKSLQMEAELEKQMQLFEADRKTLQTNFAEQEKRCRELEAEMRKFKAENDTLRSQLMPMRGNKGSSSPRTSDDTSSIPMTSSVAKVVQPTATVSSVPVSGPTTGIAQSISPGQALRQTATPVMGPVHTPSKVSSVNTGARIHSPASATPVLPTGGIANSVIPGAGLVSSNMRPLGASMPLANKTPFHGNAITPTVAASTSVPVPAVGGNVPVGGGGGGAPAPQPTPPKKGAMLSRGLPPPIPPNKPVIVTKQSVPRRSESDLDKKKPAAATPPTTTKDTTTTTLGKSTPGAVAAKNTTGSSGSTVVGDDHTSTATAVATAAAPAQGIEILGQELADFQQMLVTMATGNTTNHNNNNTSS